MTNEEWYDREIAPKLAALADQCGERGLSFLAAVEYEPGSRARTERLVNPGLEMRMLSLCCQAGVNVDGYLINLLRHCREHGIEFTNSIFLRRADNGGADRG